MKNVRLPLAILLAVLLIGGLGWFVWSSSPTDAAVPADATASNAPVKRVPVGDVPTVKQTAASGTVRDEASGDGLGGAVIQFVALDGDVDDADLEPIVAGDDGTWSTDAIVSGRYRVTATAAGHRPGVLQEVTLAPAEENAGLDLALAPGGNRVFGTIADATGGGIEGAVVRAHTVAGVVGFRGETRFSTLTDVNGHYALHLADGRILVSASHPDYAPERRALKLAGGDRKLDISLTPMGILEGVVLTRADRSPVAGARVSYGVERDLSLPGGSSHQSSRTLGQTKTDAQGRFRISGLVAGTITLSAVTEGWATAETTRVPLGVAERREGIELLVDTAFSIRGRVVTSADPARGISSAEVAVVSGTMADSSGGGETDEDGAFAIHGLQKGTVRLAAFARGYVPTLSGATVEVDGDVEGVVIELDAGLAIVGRVDPPQVAEVALDFDPGKMSFGSGMMMIGGGASTMSAPDGTFELRPVQPGEWSVSARTDDGRGGSAEVEVTDEGAPEVVIELGTRASVAGVVRDSAGAPIEGAAVQFSKAQSGSSMITVVVNGSKLGAATAPTDEAGEYIAAGLTEGEYTVQVIGPMGDKLSWADGSSKALGLTLRDSERRTGFNLDVETLDGSITGVVRETGGAPVPDVWVRAVGSMDLPEPEEEDGPKSKAMFAMVIADGEGGESMGAASESRPVLTDAEGRFTIERLRDRDYTVIAEGTGSSARTKLEGVRPGSDVVLELAASGGVKVTVSFEGRPVTGGSATLSGPVTRSKRFGSDSFEIGRLEPGRYRLSVTAQMGGASTDVVVTPGETTDVDVGIEKWVHVRGRVVDASGDPVVGARIEISDAAPRGEDGGTEVSITAGGDSAGGVRTDDEGRFETTVGGGPRMVIVLGADMPMPLAMKPFTVRGEDVELGDIETDERAGFSFSLGGDSHEE